MAMVTEICRATGADPKDVVGMRVSDLMHEAEGTEDEETGGGGDQKITEESSKAAGKNEMPGCLFHTCFACENGHCTVLDRTDFSRPCPFYKTKEKLTQERSDSFDLLLLRGRLDLINQYETVLVSLGVMEPEDEGCPIDEDIEKARTELLAFQDELQKEQEGGEDADFFSFS